MELRTRGNERAGTWWGGAFVGLARDAGSHLAVLGIAFLVSAAGHAQTAEPSSLETDDRRVVGAFVQQREVGWLDVRVDERGYLIPLHSFAEIAGCEVLAADGLTRVVTPLGPVDLTPAELLEADGVVYIHEGLIEDRLAADVEFDTARYALSFDLPWRPGMGGAPPSAVSLVPDATPPGFSLSTLRTDLRYNRIEGNEVYGSTWDMAGRLGPGYWRLRYENDLSSQHKVRDYAWFNRYDSWMLLAGNQRVRLHPLFGSLEITGAQAAWTNEPVERFSRGASSRELLPRRTSPIDSFVGYGPPAGLAVLRIDGVVVERRRIAIDGRYEFLDITIPARRASRVEVLLYDRRSPDVPVQILEETRTASEYLLPDGALVQVGGAGREGNLILEGLDKQHSFGFAGFYQTRYGLSDAVTIEGAVQHTGSDTQTMAGIVSRLSPAVVMSTGLGASDGRLGYNFDMDALWAPWRVVLRSQATEAGYYTDSQVERHDHYFEWGYSQSRTFDLALIGRNRTSTGGDVTYLLPAAAWRPAGPIWLRAWPDVEGDYRFDLNYRVTPRSSASLSMISRRAFVEYYQQFESPYRLRLATQFGDDRGTRHEAIVSWYGRGRWQPSWQAGPLVTEGQLGVLLGGRVQIARGIYANAQFESDARIDDPLLARTDRFLFNITADLGFSGGRMVAARTTSIREDRGGVAGGVRVEAPEGFPDYDLGGLMVLLDGKQVAYTGPDGSFFVGGLKPGIYRFELDPRNLPIELEPFLGSVNVQVGAAAVTRADFVVRPEFGVAGRVRDIMGESSPDVVVEVIDNVGTIHRAASTDRFGLFRIDGLPVGSYTLRIAASGFPDAEFDMPSRQFQIEDDFLFDLDLSLPIILEDEAD